MIDVVDPDEPLALGMRQFTPRQEAALLAELPPDVAARLAARCRREHLVTASGAADLSALLDQRYLERGAGEITLRIVHETVHGAAGEDLARLATAHVRAALLRGGYPEAAAALPFRTGSAE